MDDRAKALRPEHVLDSQFSKRASAAEGELERKRITEMTSKRKEESTRCASFRPAAPNILGTSDGFLGRLIFQGQGRWGDGSGSDESDGEW